MAVSRTKIKRDYLFQSTPQNGDSADIRVSRSTKLGDQMAIDVRGLAPLLSVFDMPTSIKFYCDGLGFEVVGTDGKPAPRFDWALLRLDSAELMLNTAYDEDERPSVPDPARIAAHQDAALYFGCPDVEGAYAHLREKGIKAQEPKIASYGMKQLYLTDPDGYLLCFQWQADKQTGAT